MWRLQNIEGLVGANDDTIFDNLDNIGSLPREKMVEKTGLTPELFREHLTKARESGRFPDGRDVPVMNREKGCGKGIPIPLEKKVFVALWALKHGYGVISGGSSDTFGIARTTMEAFFGTWIDWIHDELYAEEVFYDAELLKRNASIYAKVGKPGCCLSIDGTVVDWDSFPKEMRADCRYRKGGLGLNFQISVGPQLR